MSADCSALTKTGVFMSADYSALTKTGVSMPADYSAATQTGVFVPADYSALIKTGVFVPADYSAATQTGVYSGRIVCRLPSLAKNANIAVRSGGRQKRLPDSVSRSLEGRIFNKSRC